jgi:hypothetical protein
MDDHAIIATFKALPLNDDSIVQIMEYRKAFLNKKTG